MYSKILEFILSTHTRLFSARYITVHNELEVVYGASAVGLVSCLWEFSRLGPYHSKPIQQGLNGKSVRARFGTLLALYRQYTQVARRPGTPAAC